MQQEAQCTSAKMLKTVTTEWLRIPLHTELVYISSVSLLISMALLMVCSDNFVFHPPIIFRVLMFSVSTKVTTATPRNKGGYSDGAQPGTSSIPTCDLIYSIFCTEYLVQLQEQLPLLQEQQHLHLALQEPLVLLLEQLEK
jgi:hypothetical protein